MNLLGRVRDLMGFTHGEVRAAAVLSLALAAGHVIRLVTVDPGVTPEDARLEYRALDSMFTARSAPTASGTATVAAERTPSGPVNINTADESALAGLPGIGPVTARRIVDHRRVRGPFRSVSDLLAVRGIGPKRLATLRDLVVVQ